jgi:uncharacterized membrane protein YedE/YeeE
MLRQILYLTGIDRKLRSFKERIEDQALWTLNYAKALAIRTSIGAGLSVVAVMLVLWALIGGLIALFFAMQPEVGSAAAAGIIAAGLLVIALALAIAAAIVFRRDTPTVVRATRNEVKTDANRPGAEEPRGFGRTPPPRDAPRIAGLPPRDAVSRAEAASLFGLARPFASPLKTGFEPVDNLLEAAAPKAQEAAADAVVRAASLVRYGDRTTFATVLGAAVAIGWLISRTSDRSRGA